MPPTVLASGPIPSPDLIADELAAAHAVFGSLIKLGTASRERALARVRAMYDAIEKPLAEIPCAQCGYVKKAEGA